MAADRPPDSEDGGGPGAEALNGPDDRDDWDDKVAAARRLLREAMARPVAVPVTIRSRRDPPPQG